MFTGLIEEVGTVRRVTGVADGTRMDIAARLVPGDLRTGDSVAVDGVCLTVIDHAADGFAVHAIAATLGRTTIGTLRPDSAVNLERALAAHGRFGGHIVQGHVDGVGEVTAVVEDAGHALVDVAVPDIVLEATVLHGSIAINGVSLTVNALAGDQVQVALIPHTWQHTNLARLRPGDRVNLEADLIGKYVMAHLKRMQGITGHGA
jgi:riboflavin synthase